jgi:hypothetical protein
VKLRWFFFRFVYVVANWSISCSTLFIGKSSETSFFTYTEGIFWDYYTNSGLYASLLIGHFEMILYPSFGLCYIVILWNWPWILNMIYMNIVYFFSKLTTCDISILFISLQSVHCINELSRVSVYIFRNLLFLHCIYTPV